MPVSRRKHWDFELLGCAHALSSDIERVADSESGIFPSVRTKLDGTRGTGCLAIDTWLGTIHPNLNPSYTGSKPL